MTKHQHQFITDSCLTLWYKTNVSIYININHSMNITFHVSKCVYVCVSFSIQLLEDTVTTLAGLGPAPGYFACLFCLCFLSR